MAEHRPSYGNYTRGCRCDGCREAKREYMRGRRATCNHATETIIDPDTREPSQVAPIKRHGTRYGYEERGCRCDLCRKAHAASDKRRKQGSTDMDMLSGRKS